VKNLLKIIFTLVDIINNYKNDKCLLTVDYKISQLSVPCLAHFPHTGSILNLSSNLSHVVYDIPSGTQKVKKINLKLG
jgi:hypothetical protein